MMLNLASRYHSFAGSILILLSVLGCSANAHPDQGDLDTLVKSRLGAHYTLRYNETKQYVLCQQTGTNSNHAYRSFKFVVVKTTDNTITEEGSFRNGYVKWIDDSSIEVSSAGADEKRQIKIVKVSDQQS